MFPKIVFPNMLMHNLILLKITSPQFCPWVNLHTVQRLVIANIFSLQAGEIEIVHVLGQCGYQGFAHYEQTNRQHGKQNSARNDGRYNQRYFTLSQSSNYIAIHVPFP